jgi:hypothetical protein
MTYAVHLIDYPHSTPDVLKLSVQRFTRELEKKLGDRTEQAFKAFQNASESSAEDLTADEIGLAADWAKAYDAAKTAGFRDLGDTDEAYFEVRLD